MERITSPNNDTVKLLRGLVRKKARQETGLFLAEGERLVREALAHNWKPKILAFSEPALAERYHAERILEVSGIAEKDVILPDRLIEKISTKSNAVRVVGAFHQRKTHLPETDDTGRWIALYNVRDPGNLGTILRTADCAGASGVILVGECCDPYSVECVRASMGSVFALAPIHASFGVFDAWRESLGISLFAASMRGELRPDAVPLTQAHCWLMGNEQAGLPEKVESACDTLVRIPMREGADSLNLAQATTLLTYESWRQRQYV